MADCDCLAGCPFFNDKMGGAPALATLYKKQFCRGQFESCARHIVFKALGKPGVPGDLFPNQIEIARKIVGTQ